jgi:uncharacterized surface protein with fasciclin (FAS1) repeats
VKRSQGTRGLLVPVVAVLVAALTGCGSGSAGTAASSSGSSSVASSSPVAVLPPPPSDQPFGTGCAAAVPAGAAAAMAREPVVLAASQDPALTPFVVAIQTANLSDSFDSLQNITVLAPVATAVGAIHRATWRTLLADPARMTEVLTHHVIQGRLTPAQLAGTWPTLNNDTVTITGNGAVFTVAAGETMAGAKPAAVVCGNVQTANATIYLIDQVLKPQGF